MSDNKSIELNDNSGSDGDVKILTKRKRGSGGDVIDVDAFHKKSSSNLKKQCEQGDLNRVKELIKSGLIADEACVYRAAKEGHRDIVRHLLDINTHFNINIFLFIKDTQTLQILLSRQDLANSPKDDSERKILENMKKIGKLFSESAKRQQEEYGAYVELCESRNFGKIKELLSEGKMLPPKILNLCFEKKDRELFKVLISEKSLFLGADGEDGLKEVSPVLTAVHLQKIVECGWFEEANSLLENGLRYSHDEIDEENPQLLEILSKHPKQLDFPFCAIDVWYQREKSVGLMTVMEHAIVVRQKILRLFDIVKDRNLEEKAYIKAFCECMKSFLMMKM